MFQRIGLLLLFLGTLVASSTAEAGGCVFDCAPPNTQREVDLTLSKRQIGGPEFPIPGETVTYELRVENLDDQVARCVRIIDFLPDETAFAGVTVTDDSGDKDGDLCCVDTANGVECELSKFKANNPTNPKVVVIEVEAEVEEPSKRLANLGIVLTDDNDTNPDNSADTHNMIACSIRGTNGPDNLFGTSGDDIICGLGGADQISGLGGNDCIFGGGGADDVLGGPGDDIILGERGRDNIHGEGGEDSIFGGEGRDDLNGGDGADIIHGEGGGDLLIGGDGRDDLFGGIGNDVLLGGPGADLLLGGAGNSDNCSGGGQAGDVEVDCEE